MKIEIKNRYTDEVLFSHDCEYNTIAKTLKEGLKQEAGLKWANLKGAYLKGTGLYQFVGFGSAARWTTLDTINQKVICGCFYGTLEEFKAKVNKTHGDNFHGITYRYVIELMEKIL